MAPLDVQLGLPGTNPYDLLGRARLYRVGLWRFPVHRLVGGGETIATLGRGDWLTVNFGRGQRIELPNGSAWRIRSVGAGGTFLPIVIDEQRRAVATSGTSHGTYGLNLRDHACVLVPAEAHHTIGRANRWILRDHDGELATLTRSPAIVDAIRPTHLGAILLAFELIRHGLAEESMPRIPAFRWNR